MRLRMLWRNLTSKQKLEDDLNAELESYRQMLENDKGTARQAALEMGGKEQIKEAVRDVRAGAWLDSFWAEVKQSVRGLARNPGTALLGTSMLALGMTASTVIFSVFYAALVRPLPFREPDRLVEIRETRLNRGIDQASPSEANFWDVKARNRSFEEVAAAHDDEFNMTGMGQPEKVKVLAVSANFLRTLGVQPVLGRDFRAEDARDGWNTHVAIVGYKYWLSRFGGQQDIVGKTLRLNDHMYTIAGVLPPGEPWIDKQLYVPFGYHADANRGSWEFGVIARLKPGVTVESARADLQIVAGALGRAYASDDEGIGFRLEPSRRWVASKETRVALWVLLAAVVLLQVIACVNVANLLLARGLARQREIAVRSALGASRGRLIRFVMMESLLISSCGAVSGLLGAFFALSAIQQLDLKVIPRLAEAQLNVWVLSFAVISAVATGVLAGLAPALHAPTTQIASTLREGERQTVSRGQNRLRAILVTGEVALSFLLLTGAGLLTRSFSQLAKEKLGFETENRLVFSVSMPGSYSEKGVGKQFLDQFLPRIAALPGVEAVGGINSRPVEGWDPGMAIDSSSRAESRINHAPPWAAWRVVTPDYFHAVGLPLVRGRVFDEHDPSVWAEPGKPEPARRVILCERLAKMLFADGDPIGKSVVVWKGQSNGNAEVIGVVADSHERGPKSGNTLTVYIPYGRNALTSEFVVHTRGNPLNLVGPIRSILGKLDPNLPLADVRSFEEIVHLSLSPQKFNTIVLSIFGGLALLLAVAGIYGVLSYSMSRRTAEIGLRVALGASGASILRLTVLQGMGPVLGGVVLGAVSASALSHSFAALLFGVKPFDLATYAAVTVLLLITAVAASYFPGRRAMRVDPIVALRNE
jgi:putative ABC transport system permease protein